LLSRISMAACRRLEVVRVEREEGNRAPEMARPDQVELVDGVGLDDKRAGRIWGALGDVAVAVTSSPLRDFGAGGDVLDRPGGRGGGDVELIHVPCD
jgi:hypothetical protein